MNVGNLHINLVYIKEKIEPDGTGIYYLTFAYTLIVPQIFSLKF